MLSSEPNLDWLDEPMDTPSGAVCAVRDQRTGQSFLATDGEANDFPAHSLHPVVQARGWAEHRLIELHRHLRRHRSTSLPGLGLTTATVNRELVQSSSFLENLLIQWRLAPQVQGANVPHQFRRLQQHIETLEGQRGSPLSDNNWTELLATNTNHAEVKAASDALFALNATGAEGLLGLEFHLESGNDQSDQALPRCIHCSFITEGIEPTDEVRQEELKAAQRLRSAFAL